MYLQIAAAYTFRAAFSVSSFLCVYLIFCDRFVSTYIGISSPHAHWYPAESQTFSWGQIFMWCIQKRSNCLCYLNDNSKEIAIKMIPCKYVLSCGSSLEVWNIDRSGSSGCSWLSLQHTSCLYSCASIYGCCVALCMRDSGVWEMHRFIFCSFQVD